MSRSTAQLAGLSVLTQSQIQGSTNINSLLDTAADCLRFVTEFFGVISQSATHIYRSALVLAPHSSIVWRLYSEKLCSPAVRAMTGIPSSWDSCTATATTGARVHCAVWSPCGQFIATVLESSIVEVWDSTTLERVSVLKPPATDVPRMPQSPAISPGGHLVVCFYMNVRLE